MLRVLLKLANVLQSIQQVSYFAKQITQNSVSFASVNNCFVSGDNIQAILVVGVFLSSFSYIQVTIETDIKRVNHFQMYSCSPLHLSAFRNWQRQHFPCAKCVFLHMGYLYMGQRHCNHMLLWMVLLSVCGYIILLVRLHPSSRH